MPRRPICSPPGCGLRRGSRAGVLLPPHWQTAAVLLGAWAAGIEVSFRGWGAAGLSPDTGPELDVTFVERRRVTAGSKTCRRPRTGSFWG
ncbi:hypothetical protein [Actinoplanes sp. CA-252034]|uniref:hypothetical protein n=1 Tax=Actinoplanes sp. CA-252034 TaxID=3239906 RepID=UPI003D971A11